MDKKFKRMQELAGVKKDLLSFVKQNQDEIADKIGAVRLENISIDTLGDVSADGIFLDDDDDEMEGGVAFRFSEDVDDDFVGEEDDEPMDLEINGVKLSYIQFNM